MVRSNPAEESGAVIRWLRRRQDLPDLPSYTYYIQATSTRHRLTPLANGRGYLCTSVRVERPEATDSLVRSLAEFEMELWRLQLQRPLDPGEKSYIARTSLQGSPYLPMPDPPVHKPTLESYLGRSGLPLSIPLRFIDPARRNRHGR